MAGAYRQRRGGSACSEDRAGDGRIVHIVENAKPLSDDLIPSGAAVRGVLEVIAGTAQKLGIAPGDRVSGSIFGAH